jgi:serine/threonine protein kinase
LTVIFQLNVLIDDGAKAVLCDFGLTRIKADTTSRAVRADEGGIVGTRNWMAPEQLLGKSPKMPCDIYALGMTIYEVSIGPIASQISKLNQRLVRFLRTKFHLAM